MTYPTNDPLQQSGAGADAPAKKGAPVAKLVLVVVLAAAAITFIVQNPGTGTINFLWMDWSMPYWIWFVVLLLVGVVIGSIFPWGRRKKKVAKK